MVYVGKMTATCMRCARRPRFHRRTRGLGIRHLSGGPVRAGGGGQRRLLRERGPQSVRDDINGTFRWSYATAGWVVSNPTLAVAAGVVYFGSHDGNVYALEAASGDFLWEYHTTYEATPARRWRVTSSTSATMTAAVRAGVQRHLRLQTLGSALGSWVVSGPAVADGVVYAGSGDDNVYALDAVTGHVRWTYLTGNDIFSSPVVSGNIVYIGSEDGKDAPNTGS